MLKMLFLMVTFVLLSPVTYAYSPLSSADHLQVDRQLEGMRSLSPLERKQKSDFFYRLAQKNLFIRQAFLPLTTKIYGPKMTADEKSAAERKIADLKMMSEEMRVLVLDDIKNTQHLAHELARSLQLENSATFEGYAVTKMPTPLFRYPIDKVDINKSLGGQGTTGINLDAQNLIREVAVVLPPNTVVLLMKKIQTGSRVTYQVRTREFDAGPGAKYGYFLDERFIEKQITKPIERPIQLPSLTGLQSKLLQTSGSAYVWGGSWYQGLPWIHQRFPSEGELTSSHQLQKTLQGVDCSGLLYQATDGYTPRNTRQLLTFGTAVNIEGKTAEQIAAQLKPMDLIVRAGHVVIVLDEQYTIESRWRANFAGGVEVVKTIERLQEIMTTRDPVDNYAISKLPESKKFVVRRWFPGL